MKRAVLALKIAAVLISVKVVGVLSLGLLGIIQVPLLLMAGLSLVWLLGVGLLVGLILSIERRWQGEEKRPFLPQHYGGSSPSEAPN